MADDLVDLSITKAEAIILFEFAAKLTTEQSTVAFDGAEEKVLWNIEAMLEKMLLEPFREDYEHVVDKARLEVTEDNPE